MIMNFFPPPRYTGWDIGRFTVVSTQNMKLSLVLLVINCCSVFHAINCKPAFTPPCVFVFTHQNANCACSWLVGLFFYWNTRIFFH